MRRVIARGLGVLAAGCAVFACGSPSRGPYFGDERFLVVGVQPSREADALIEQMRAHGRTLALRLYGVHHTALAFADAAGAVVAVRVVTARGIVLALDTEPRDVLRRARTWRLLPTPLALAGGGPNADDHVLVEEREDGRAACLRIFIVRPGGEFGVDARAADPEGRAACPAGEPQSPDAGLAPSE